MITRKKSLKTYTFRYSFLTDLGAQGTLLAPFTIPAGAIVLQYTVGVSTTLTGGAGAEIALGYGSGAAKEYLMASVVLTAFAATYGATFVPAEDTPGIVPAGGYVPSLTIAVADLTAGIMDVSILYLE